MKRFTTLALPLVILTQFTGLAGCDRYRVTLNERTISEPRGLLTTIEVADASLKACIEQTIQDRQIQTADQLSVLVCTHAGIASLEGIEAFSNLETLNLAENKLKSISPLLFLGKLNSVNLADNSLLECAEVEKLRQQLPKDGTLLTPEQCQ